MNQVLLIDKPAGWTSFDVVAKIRGAISQKEGKRVKVGHAGTLDPFATGLLIVLVGDATKRQDEFMKLEKEYTASMCLGETSTTGDPEGTIEEIPKSKYQIPNQEEIEKVLRKFTGKIQQTPPAYSAIKVDGQRAYKLARAGKEVKIEPRTITIYQLTITKYEFPELQILVSCSSGTYIRTLAEDIGNALGTGAYLTALKRTQIGGFELKNAQKITDLVWHLCKFLLYSL